MSNSKKRQAEDEVSSAPPKSKKKKSKFQEDDSLDMELGINSAIARMDNQLMADHLAQKTIRFGTELSTIELADLTISGKLTSHIYPYTFLTHTCGHIYGQINGQIKSALIVVE